MPPTSAHEAAVVRCSSCGAPRLGGAQSCTFCDADFTLHEQDLDTLCPSCLARISRRARFCHACATPIVVEEQAAESTSHPCPSCGGERTLSSRRLSRIELSILECRTCAGLWVGRETFEHLVERSRRGEPSVVESVPPVEKRPQTGALYRPCPYCSTLMNRRNFEKASGVILDVCAKHGLWFDPNELQGVLDWVRKGGMRAVQARREAEAREKERAQRIEQAPATRLGKLATSRASSSSWENGDLFGWFGEALVDLVRGTASLFD